MVKRDIEKEIKVLGEELSQYQMKIKRNKNKKQEIVKNETEI